jgi:hypothetical protein
MTITRIAGSRVTLLALLCGSLTLAPFVAAVAGQSATAKHTSSAVIAPSSNVQYRQNAQQQQTRSQLQQSQLEQQLHQSVSDNAKRPSASDAPALKQMDQADQSRAARAHAAQQDLLDRHQHAAELPRVIPQSRPPASSRSGG